MFRERNNSEFLDSWRKSLFRGKARARWKPPNDKCENSRVKRNFEVWRVFQRVESIVVLFRESMANRCRASEASAVSSMQNNLKIKRFRLSLWSDDRKDSYVVLISF